MSNNTTNPINKIMNGNNTKWIIAIIVTVVLAFSALTWGIIESSNNKTMDIWVEQVKQNTQDARKIDVILTEIRILKEAIGDIKEELRAAND